MTREEQVAQFDINGPGLSGKLFGLPFSTETSSLVILPVPWEATVTYRTDTAHAPTAILKSSRQIDFFMREIPDAWKLGISMMPVSSDLIKESDRLRILIEQHRTFNEVANANENFIPDKINEAGENLNIFIKKSSQELLEQGKLVGLLGGDHSTPLGLIRALSEKYDRFGILQIDAHADLRKAYEGFTYSHASIMYNALKIPAVSRLVQVGIRDWCDEEHQMMNRGMGRVKTFFDDDLKSDMSKGKTWEEQCSEIIKELPEKVYISFDIDGLDPKLCPHTGTPVPGGLEFYQATTLIKSLALSGRTIIGFDLCEVAPHENDEWDANVGARILWQLCNWTGVSNKLLQHRA